MDLPANCRDPQGSPNLSDPCMTWQGPWGGKKNHPPVPLQGHNPDNHITAPAPSPQKLRERVNLSTTELRKLSQLTCWIRSHRCKSNRNTNMHQNIPSLYRCCLQYINFSPISICLLTNILALLVTHKTCYVCIWIGAPLSIILNFNTLDWLLLIEDDLIYVTSSLPCSLLFPRVKWLRFFIPLVVVATLLLQYKCLHCFIVFSFFIYH